MYELTEEERQLIVDCIAFTTTVDAIIKEENYIDEDKALEVIEKLKTGKVSKNVSIFFPFKKEDVEEYELENPKMSLKLLEDKILPRSS
jgi:hypothetical protein